MINFPKILLTLMNVVILIYGLYHIFNAADISESSSVNECLRDSVHSIRRLGFACSAVALVGIAGACLDVRALRYVYLLALMISTAAVVVFCMFVWAVMPGVPGNVAFGLTAEHGMWLREYGSAAQKTIANDRDFTAAKVCFRRIDTCRIMKNQTEDQKDVLIDAGCCSPPNRCGMVQAPGGHWVVAGYGLNSTDAECQQWAQVGLNCFDCDSCKAGFLGSYQNKWDNNSGARVMSVMGLIAGLSVACYIYVIDRYQGSREDLSQHMKLVSTNV
ncbi:tetraspanin-10 [Striga asiatica]|uniref:Tetraspanin-10 n=1 Tax=Striga asiatica TaxID=4170 RepID=A0A5A7QRC8_STRAF|nr:tetraspanin-10 [Striga asiatica]